jgi:nitrogen fixation NifU-like protein
MIGELRDLYQDVILDHSRSPRNFGRPEGANRESEGYNPLCGDRVRIHLRLDGDRIEAVGFEGTGCAISKASASMMTSAMKGRPIADAEAFFEKFHRMLTDSANFDVRELGKVAVFAGVREFPSRIKCATLAWHTLRAALHGENGAITTE